MVDLVNESKFPDGRATDLCVFVHIFSISNIYGFVADAVSSKLLFKYSCFVIFDCILHT